LLRATLILIALLAAPTLAAKVGDITRMSSQRDNKLTAMGLVIGLKGTGDGGDFQPAIRPLAETLAKFSNATDVTALTKVKNVALVMVTAQIPVNARAGDRFDVHVHSIGSSNSLKGGTLFITPMMGPIPDGQVFGLASGPIVIEDETTPTTAVIRQGGQMEMDLPVEMIDRNGQFSLVIADPSASWATANRIAKVINGDVDDGRIIAVAIDPKNVLVTVPPEERQAPENFLAKVQEMQIGEVPVEARVTINDRTGTMIMTGDVEISPVIITHKGLTISTRLPAPTPSDRTPVLRTSEFAKLDPQNTGGAKLQDLLDALDQLKVPIADKISIIKALHETGKLHAKLIVE
jgi:flagellar P-ring protein FlgI